MQHIPLYISVVFGLTTFLTVFLFCKASGYSRNVLIIILAWLGLQSVLGLNGFYTVTDTIPPRFFLLLSIPLIFIISLFATIKGRRFIDGLDVKTLTLLHTIRIPVELVLFWLFINKAVPQLMTFEGRNFDILSGLTAPVIYFFGYLKNRLSPVVILAWNFICLGLLFNIVIIAVLSAPFAIQRFAFDQPNIALLYFPFIWLPCCVVPLVLFSHLVAIRQLLKRAKIDRESKGLQLDISKNQNS